MKRLLAVTAGLLIAGTALADIPPPIPKGFKRVPLSFRVVAGAEFPDYTLFTVESVRQIRETTRTASPAKLDAKSPLTLTTSSGASVSRSFELVAVPKNAGKAYGTEKDFHKAIAEGKVAGQVKASTTFQGASSIELKDNDPRKEVVKEFKLIKIDPKDGIVLTEAEAPKKAPGGSEEEDEPTSPDAPAALTPRAGTLVAGLAATAGVVFAGLWLTRRGRRESA